MRHNRARSRPSRVSVPTDRAAHPSPHHEARTSHGRELGDDYAVVQLVVAAAGDAIFGHGSPPVAHAIHADGTDAWIVSGDTALYGSFVARDGIHWPSVDEATGDATLFTLATIDGGVTHTAPWKSGYRFARLEMAPTFRKSPNQSVELVTDSIVG